MQSQRFTMGERGGYKTLKRIVSDLSIYESWVKLSLLCLNKAFVGAVAGSDKQKAHLLARAPR